MSNIERKEYQETKVLRTRSPMRNTRSTQNLTEFDHNLDNLLEDLQNSVSRPSSSLGKTYNGIESNRSNSLNRISHMKPSNPVTEYSSDDAYSYTSPDGLKSVKSYKKESYSYNTTGRDVPIERNRVQNNINQLDSLLDDLQQVKKGGILTDDSGIDSGLLEGDKNNYVSKKTVQRELHYGDTPPRPSSRSEMFEKQERYEKTGSLGRESRLSEGIYGETRHVRQRTPSPIHSNTSTLSRQKKVSNVHEYPVKVFETTAPDIEPEVLASLDPNLRPPGNTKVTTTIKTYTYEIPGDTPTSDSESRTEKYLYSNDSQTTPSKSFVYNKAENVSNRSETHYPPQQQDWTYKEAKLDKFSEKKEIVHPPEPQSWTYKEAKIDKFSEKKEVVQPPEQNWTFKEAKIDKFSETIQPYQKPSPPVGETTLLKETINTRNYQPGYQPEPFQPGRQKTEYFYNENVITRNYQNGYPPQHEPTPPVQRKEIYIHHETHTNKNVQNGYPPQPQPEKIISYNREDRIENIDHRKPPPTTIEHKYISHTTDTYKSGYPKSPESEPLLRPQPFPTTEIDGPPKKLDDLMATIGNEPPDSPLNAGFKAHEAEIVQQKKVEHLKQQAEEKPPKEKPKNLPATKNITGPPVYYPPGHEMFAKKEEASASMRAEGGMAQAGGKYAYEAESKSKSKSKSGAAIVPVCLPLCCGLPCVIL
ncbi:uncharacterized protein LOC108735738 [Agrilus planipennis]|uniref:Uncharacterized protein LOC108735738 n=1 Tax=Agrilus planipennis TaxID=224129 RepID=A0A1W4WTK8_AGRPL|nr:uncharacterized protein LOC108735738 [Agrilus planipennis]